MKYTNAREKEQKHDGLIFNVLLLLVAAPALAAYRHTQQAHLGGCSHHDSSHGETDS